MMNRLEFRYALFEIEIYQLIFQIVSNVIRRMSENDDRQKARTVCTIGTHPFKPEVYGVKAPL
jgi:hypothetical protein